jgi:1,4-dihydroxy-6-naphthoate synthase
MAERELRIGFSPCPNDTFVFAALVQGRVPAAGLRFAAEIEDIEQLNQRSLDRDRRLEVSKLSLPAYARVRDDHVLLAAGAALARGAGPLVIRSPARFDLQALADLEEMTVAIPGRLTTAHLLLRMFAPANVAVLPMRFDWIMPAVSAGDVDAGVIIHESRFTYEQHGLVLVADLGNLWEIGSHLPLPLGVVAARKELGQETIASIERALRASVEFAQRDPAAVRAYVRRHAKEVDDAVCERHIKLYVNEFTRDLGQQGRQAIDALLARAAGIDLG